MKLFWDENSSQYAKSEILVRFHDILEQTVEKLNNDTTNSNPDRRTIINELRELRTLVETFNLS